MNKTRSYGFTLIEVMITVVIIGILAAIAYPSYTRYTQQARRSDGQIALTNAASSQEKYMSQCAWYAAALGGAARACGAVGDATTSLLGSTTVSPGNYYTLAVVAGNINGTCSGGAAAYTCGFTITATPQGTQTGNGALRIDAIGNRQWDRANNGTYSARWTDK